MNILILAAGEPNSDGDGYPIWLSEVDDQLLLERQVRALSLVDSPRLVFAFRREDVESFHLGEITQQIAPRSTIVELKRDTAGAACTALMSLGLINLDEEIVVASATDHIDADYAAIVAEFKAQGADAGIVTFESLHPRYSFVRVDDSGQVLEAAEKRPISRVANAGLYWYARASDFFDSLKAMIIKDAHVNGRFYISPSLNELVLRQKKVLAYRLQADQYHPLKANKHVEVFEQLREKDS